MNMHMATPRAEADTEVPAPHLWTTDYSIYNPRSVRPDMRVAATDILTASSFVGSVGVIDCQGGKLPLAGVVLRTNLLPTRVLKQINQPTQRLNPDKIKLLEVFPSRSAGEEGPRLTRAKQLAVFAREYAAALADGLVPVVIVRDDVQPGRDKKIDPATDPSIAAFFTGMVASALRPNGVVLCTNDTIFDERCLHSDGPVDSLALAVSQGRTALSARRIFGNNQPPEWRLPITQLRRFRDAVSTFRATTQQQYERGNGGWQRYWIEPGVQPAGEKAMTGAAFAQPHAVMINGAPWDNPSTAWTKRMIPLMRPGSTTASHPFKVFARWLVTHGAELTRKGADVIAAPSRPSGTPTDAVFGATEENRHIA